VLQLDQPNRSLLGVTGLPAHTVQEEREPGKGIAALAREEQVVVVLAAVLLEIGGQVEQWLQGGGPPRWPRRAGPWSLTADGSAARYSLREEPDDAIDALAGDPRSVDMKASGCIGIFTTASSP
jgi:hypothetical protein